MLLDMQMNLPGFRSNVCTIQTDPKRFFILALAKQGDNALGSLGLSVCLSELSC